MLYVAAVPAVNILNVTTQTQRKYKRLWDKNGNLITSTVKQIIHLAPVKRRQPMLRQIYTTYNLYAIFATEP